MKKFVCLFLMVTMLLPAVAACGQVDPPAEPVTVAEEPVGAPVKVLWYTEGYDYETEARVGETPVPPEIQETVYSDKYVFTFTGWDRELVPITAEAAARGEIYYTALYNKEKRAYPVNFVVDGKIVETKQAYYGDAIPEPTVSIPEKEGFPYSIWLSPSQTVSKENTVTATYASSLVHTINKTASVQNGVLYMPLEMQKHASGRSTPVASNPSSGYDSLIFYSPEVEGIAPDPDKTVDQMLTERNIPSRKILNNNALLNAYVSGASYASNSIVAVSDANVPFTQARRFVVSTKPSVDYDIQLSMNMSTSDFSAGDVLVLSCWIRFVSANVESNCGQVRFSCQHPTSYSKNLNYTISKAADGKWFRFIMPFTAKAEFSNLVIAFGGCVQTMEIAGYEIRNCGSNVSVDEIPRDSLATLSEGLGEMYDRDAQWRKDAWAKIEAIRMGDLTVTVQDQNGKVIPNAEVKVEMTEHDFKFGTCIAEILMNNQNYNQALSAFFNSAVSGSGTKWACYEREPERALYGHGVAEKLGMTYFRGHTLVWDYPLTRTTDANGDYKFDDNIPERLWLAIKTRNQEAMEKYYQEWIRTACQTFSYVGEWDVLNEPNHNHNLIDQYGYELVKKWFDWAKEYSPEGTKLYINEATITDSKTQLYVDKFINFAKGAMEAGVEFDGIGVQGHFDEFASPLEFYNNLQQLAALGKEMKITEFDNGRVMRLYPYMEASFLRDTMILMFSMEEMTGFFMWGFWDKMSTWENAPLFDADWNLKISGEQYLDLVYNQWWTRETGRTGADGTFHTRAYYGTYDITVTVNGKTVTETVSMAKGEEGNFTIRF